jgi:hypothetical protein
MTKHRVYFWNENYKDNQILSEVNIVTEGEWTEFYEDDVLALRVRTNDVIFVIREDS